MPATTQEELLQQRFTQLGKLENQLSKLPAAEFRERKSLQEDVARQKKALGEELALRDAYRQQAAVQQTLDSHEKLKASLQAMHAQRPLNREEIAAYHASRDRCRNALAKAGVPAANPLDTQAARAQLENKKEGLQRSFRALKAANADLYRDSVFGAPCVPCLQKRFDKIAKTVKIKSLKARQHYSNCGVMSSALLLNLVSCPGDIAGIGEEAMLDDAMMNGNARRVAERDPGPEDRPFIARMTKPARARYESGGTGPKNRKKIIDGKGKDRGISVEQVPYSEFALGQALEDNKPVILAVEVLYLKPCYDDDREEMVTWPDNHHGGHAITAVDKKYDAVGKMLVLISDTGCGEQYWMNASDLTKAIVNFPTNVAENELRARMRPYKPPLTTPMNVSNKPIKTDCKQ